MLKLLRDDAFEGAVWTALTAACVGIFSMSWGDLLASAGVMFVIGIVLTAIE